MSYIVKEKDSKIGILESTTDVFITFKKKEQKEIQSIARKLNLGGGFNGWTPTFFASFERDG